MTVFSVAEKVPVIALVVLCILCFIAIWRKADNLLRKLVLASWGIATLYFAFRTYVYSAVFRYDYPPDEIAMQQSLFLVFAVVTVVNVIHICTKHLSAMKFYKWFVYVVNIAVMIIESIMIKRLYEGAVEILVCVIILLDIALIIKEKMGNK